MALSSLISKIVPAAVSTRNAVRNFGTDLVKGGAKGVLETGVFGEGLKSKVSGPINSAYTKITGKAPAVPLSPSNALTPGTAKNTNINNMLSSQGAAGKTASGLGYGATMLFGGVGKAGPSVANKGAKWLSPAMNKLIDAPVVRNTGGSAARDFPSKYGLANKLAQADAGPLGPKAPARSAASKLETKTTTARSTPKIDTRPSPIKAGTVNTGRKLPIGKTAIGLGAAGLGIGALNSMNNGNPNQTPQNLPTYEGSNSVFPQGQGPTPTMDEGLNPDSVWGGGYEGGSFESSFAPTSTSASFGTGGSISGTPAGGIGAGSFGGAATSPFTSVAGGKSMRELELEKLLGYTKPTDEEEKARKQEDKLAERLASLTENQELENLEIEGEPISADARAGRRGFIDLQTRRSMVPLQTSLALVQALRERSEGDREKLYDNEKYRFEQLYPVPKENEAPSNIQEYEYARNQGYGGTYTDFLNSVKRNEQMEQGDKLLSPTEAFALGVPYGTTQSQAYGVNPSKLSGDAAKIQAITQTIVPEINSLKARFQQDYRGALWGYLTGTDRELVKLVDQVADKVGRLRSGGAVNYDEEQRFKRQIASLADLPFGDSQEAITALDGLISEAESVSQSINPYAQQGMGGGSYGGGGQWGW